MPPPVRLDHPATYRITVQGRLGAGWAAWFDGLALATPEPATTTLTGTVADQAALHALLRRLYHLGLPLVAVQHLPPSSEEP